MEEGQGLRCPCCGELYPVRDGYVDLVPRKSLGDKTLYTDHEFHERLHVTDAPPLLSARVKADMMRRFLDPSPGEDVLDLGCGPGKFALFAGRDGAKVTGVDLAPFFLPRALREVDLALGDLRRLPFRKGSYPQAYSLDVLEHFDEAGLKDLLVEVRRVLGPSGKLFVYTHAMESSSLARFQRLVNRLAKRLGDRGLLDYEREALRKSDHKNPITSHDHFDALCAEAGLFVRERRYYNVVMKAIVEDLLLRLYEHGRRRANTAPPASVGSAEGAIGAAPPRFPVFFLGVLLTWLLKLDVVLFGGIRTGPFFGLLESRRP
jgi:SAM-dependent methyltransferase